MLTNSKAISQDQNLADASHILYNRAYMSKAELSKALEFSELENSKLRKEVIRLKNKLLIRQEEIINSESKDCIEVSFLKAV